VVDSRRNLDEHVTNPYIKKLSGALDVWIAKDAEAVAAVEDTLDRLDSELAALSSPPSWTEHYATYRGAFRAYIRSVKAFYATAKAPNANGLLEITAKSLCVAQQRFSRLSDEYAKFLT
jgi:hypothetical protein